MLRRISGTKSSAITSSSGDFDSAMSSFLKTPDGKIVADAEQKSHDLVQSYLMNEASGVHVAQPSLVDFGKKKKSSRTKKEKRERKARKEKRKNRRNASSGSSLASDTTTAASESGEEMERETGSPVTMMLEELRKVCPPGKSPRTFCSLQMYDDFEEWTAAQKSAYDKDAIAAIRSQDVATLKKWHSEGRILQAANSFGESLLHMACRRGFLSVVKYLVEDAGHNLWIRDDTGRTPLHDACWTAMPSPELVKFILDREPDLLLVSDKRGHTPLDYARKDHWQTWIDFFGCMDCSVLLPKRECFTLIFHRKLTLRHPSRVSCWRIWIS
mmetsp:Transcript_24338/g.40342  ORF Transcript_24338/g.40342 Transcript_24338/m.40342 type:complete len:328 (-) Transcript_24338:275-1258(-)